MILCWRRHGKAGGCQNQTKTTAQADKKLVLPVMREFNALNSLMTDKLSQKHEHHCAKCFAEVAQQLLMHGVYLHGILLHEHHCAKCCIMREPLLELIWYLENFIQRLIRYLLSRHPRKTETRTKVQAFFKKRRPRILTL